MISILIVDDDFRICRNLSEILADEGYSVESATSGEEALKLIKKKFDIAIVDLMMPGMSGMELLSEIRRNEPNTHVIMITAFGTIENAVEAMKMGAADYITKPFKTNEIQVAAKRILEEINFKNNIAAAAKSAESEKLISALNSSIRRGVILYLSKKKYTFSEIQRAVEVDDPTKLNFHIQKLKSHGLVEQDESKRYFLTAGGKKALDILMQLKA